MPSYGPQQLDYKVLNSNSVAVMIGDALIGFAQTVSPTADLGAESLYGIGSPKIQEIQQLRFSPSISIDSFRLTAEGLQYFGIGTPLSSVLANNSFSIYLLDINGNAILAYVGCVATTYNTSASTNAVITEAITFTALDILDNSGNSILNGPAALNTNPLASAQGSAFSVPGQG